MKKHTVLLLEVMSLSFFAFACAPSGFREIKDASNYDSTQNSKLSKLECAPDPVDYQWDINIYGFSLSGYNFFVGYNGEIVSPISSIAIGAKVETGTLNLQMTVKKPYDLVSRSVGANVEINTGFDFSVDLGIIKFGAGSGQKDGQAALIKLTEKAFNKLVTNAAVNLKSDPNPWSTHITKKLSENKFIIPSGAIAGIKYGDRFNVYKYEFENFEDCERGQLIGSKALPALPIATIVPIDIKEGYTVMALSGLSGADIEVNDLVEIQKLQKQNEKRKLKRSVRIAGLNQPNEIKIIDSQGTAREIDVRSYLKYQIPTIIQSSDFWLIP